jgi:putative ABC transport system permease protein
MPATVTVEKPAPDVGTLRALVFAMDTILDLRYALRKLAANPGFTFVAVLTLALGIGANTAIYSVIDGVLLHPVPFPEADRLVALFQKARNEEKNSVSYPNLLDWQKQSQTFEGIAGALNQSVTLTGHGQPEELLDILVSSNFFAVLRVNPVLGRTFTAAEDEREAAPVAMLGEDFWRRRFAADPKMVGQTLTLNGRPYTIIGIVPASVRLERDGNSFQNDAFLPLGQETDPFFYRTAIACQKTGRQARLIEQAPGYCDLIVRRWQAFTGLEAQLESDGKPFREVAAARMVAAG